MLKSRKGETYPDHFLQVLQRVVKRMWDVVRSWASEDRINVLVYILDGTGVFFVFRSLFERTVGTEPTKSCGSRLDLAVAQDEEALLLVQR